MKQSTSRLVLFDVDGTMLDSRGAIVTAMAAAFIRCQLTPPPPPKILAKIGLSLHDMVTALAEGHRDVPVSRIVAAYQDAYFSPQLLRSANDLRFPGLAAMLEHVNTPDTIMGIVTGRSRRSLDYAFETQQLDPYFPIHITADDGPSKPAGDLVMIAMAEAGVTPEQTVMVGDTTFDILMAHAASVPAIGVAWGYHGKDALKALGVPVASSMYHLPGVIETIRPTEKYKSPAAVL